MEKQRCTKCHHTMASSPEFECRFCRGEEPREATIKEKIGSMKLPKLGGEPKIIGCCIGNDGTVDHHKSCKQCDETNELLRELFYLLDWKEESSNGDEFNPTSIRPACKAQVSSCRVMHCEKLDRILPRLKEISEE